MRSLRISPDLELRLLQPADAPGLFALIDSDRAHLREWLPWVDATVKVRDTEKFIAKMLREFAETQAYSAGIWSGGRLVGVIGHNRIDWATRIAFPGWWIASAGEGRGLMAQCCKAVFAHAFTQLKVNRVVVGVATENARGLAIVRRLGFTQLNLLRNAERLHNRTVDHFIFTLAPAPAGPPKVSA